MPLIDAHGRTIDYLRLSVSVVSGKPDGHGLNAARPADQKERGMYAIGG